MRLTETQIVRAVTELIREKKVEDVDLIENVVGFLKKRRLLGSERKIIAALEREIDRMENRVRVTVLSARTLDARERTQVSERLAVLFPKKKLELQYREKSDLIGGIAFETDDIRYDATLSRSLQLLSHQL